jgi:hypothetical protein
MAGVGKSRQKSIIQLLPAFLTQRSTVLVVHALILSHLDCCAIIWSSAAKKDLAKLQLAQNKAACLALNCLPITAHTELTSTACMIAFHG